MLPLDPAAYRLLTRLHAVAAQALTVEVWTARDCPPCDDGLSHAVPTLVLGLSGVVRLSAARRRCDLAPGQALLIAPGAFHRHEALRPGCAAFAQGFVAGGSDIFLTEPGGVHGGLMPAQPSWSLLNRALRVPRGERAILVSGCVQAALTEARRPLGSMPAAVRRMYDLLWWDPPATLTIAVVVRGSGLAASQAHALFKAWSGTTPKQALLALRAARALQHLREGATVAEASARAGFAAPYLLTRAFRRRHGLPPTRWAEVGDGEPP